MLTPPDKAAPERMKTRRPRLSSDSPRMGLTPKIAWCFEPACQCGEEHRVNPNLSPDDVGARRADCYSPHDATPMRGLWDDQTVDPVDEVHPQVGTLSGWFRIQKSRICSDSKSSTGSQGSGGFSRKPDCIELTLDHNAADDSTAAADHCAAYTKPIPHSKFSEQSSPHAAILAA